MSEEFVNTCSHCGATMPANAPEGLCPRCVLAGAAATEAASDALPHRAAAPPVAAVAAAFPNLEVLELIGQGGMGCVFKARQTQLNRFVALKILPEALARDPAFAARFAREAQALAALNHPNIVTIHDFGRANGFFFLLMELVDGVNLRQALRAGRFTPTQALAIVPPICDALQYAHERGIVHRDIKPENLLLEKSGRVKIADFGIAKMLGTKESGDANHLTAAGTPQYMAPEQRERDGQTDHRADIYSLGVVLYELLTGEPPKDNLQPPSRKVQIDVRLDEVVLRALEREPDRRYATALEFKTNLETVTAASAAAPKLRAQNALVIPSANSGRLALGFLLAGTLGTLVLMTLSPRHELALVFGAVALLLALVFGVISWREKAGRAVTLSVVAIAVGIGIALAVLSGAMPWTKHTARRLLAEQLRRAEEVQMIARRAALERVTKENAPPNHEDASARAETTVEVKAGNDPRALVDLWLGHVKANRVEPMWALTTRESGGAGSVDLRNTWKYDDIKAYTLAWTSNAAMVVTTLYKDNAGRERRIVFSLGRLNGQWLIHDHWTVSPEVAESRLDGFITGSGARFNVRRSDVVGRWDILALPPASFEFRDNGEFRTSYRTVGGNTTLTGSWSLQGDQLRYETDAGAITGRVVNVREDFLQLQFQNGNVSGYHRAETRATSEPGTRHFAMERQIILTTNEFFSFEGQKIKLTKPRQGSVRLLHENGQYQIEIDGMHSFRLKKDQGIEQWNSKSAAEVIHDYQKAGFALLPSERFSRAALKEGELPLTFLLPGTGFLQVIEMDPARATVRLRWKVVQP